MNARQFRDLLKNLQKMTCPACEEVYQIDEIQFLGQVDGLFLMQMSCSGCNLQSLMNIMVTGNKSLKSKFIVNDLTLKENFSEDEISADEIIHFHQHLKSFQGDFKKELLG